MITALDHIVLLCPDLEEGAEAYRTLLGAPHVWSSVDGGIATAIFKTGNVALELMAPQGESETADKLRQMTADGARLTTLVYRSDDLGRDHKLFTNRDLSPSEISEGESSNLPMGEIRRWNRFRIPDDKMAGVKTFVLEPTEGELPDPKPIPGGVLALDHVVVNTPNPQRFLASYGAGLGFDLRMDRTFEDWGARLMFFRVGDLILEVMHPLKSDAEPDAQDSVWGLSWRVESIEEAHARLTSERVNVSEIRAGRKPGTRVFTAKSGTLDIPTLFIGPDQD